MIFNLITCVNELLRPGKMSHVFAEGKLTFLPGSDENKIHIYEIRLHDKYQNQGILTMFLKYLADHFEEIWFFQCNEFMSFIILTTRLNGIYFVNRGMGSTIGMKTIKTTTQKRVDGFMQNYCH